MSSRSRTVTIVLAIIASIFAGWGFMRSSKYGLNNIFSREHTFVDRRPLTNDIAIELSKMALKEGGYNASELAPKSGYSRNIMDPNSGYVLWGPLPEEAPWRYLVSVRKEGKKVRCRVTMGK